MIIRRYPIALTNEQLVAVPEGSKFLCVKTVQHQMSLYYMINLDKEPEIKTICMYGEGHTLPKDIIARHTYLDSVTVSDCTLHIFECLK